MYTQRVENSYDFIVVGAGSAGSVIANRLSEIGGWSVLLLEAGGDEPILGQVPVNAGALQLSPYDWQFKTLPQTSGACAAFENKLYVNNKYNSARAPKSIQTQLNIYKQVFLASGKSDGRLIID